MITEWFMGLGGMVLDFLFGVMPPIPNESAFIINPNDLLTPFMAGINGLGVWLPWQVLTFFLPLVLSVYLISLFARALRAVLGHIPLIGGNG